MLSHARGVGKFLCATLLLRKPRDQADFGLRHVDDLDVLVPQVHQLEDVAKTLLECLESEREGRPNLVLSLGHQHPVKLFQLAQGISLPLFRCLRFD